MWQLAGKGEMEGVEPRKRGAGRAWASRFSLCFSACGLLLLTGCTSPQSAPPPELPKVRDLRPAVAPPPPPPVLETAPAKWVVSVTRVEIPLDVPTNDLWSVIDENAAPARARSAWHANGLRVGVLDPHDLDRLDDVLPVVLGRSGSSYVNASIPVPVRTSGRLTRPVPVQLPDNARSLDGGRLQLLMAPSDFRAGVALDLVPHHYLPRTTLLPRDPLDRKLEGEVIDALGVRLLLQPGQYVLVGLHWPWLDAADLQPENLFGGLAPEPSEPAAEPTAPPSEAAEAGEPAETEQPETPEEPSLADQVPDYRRPDLARNLGSLLMTGRRGDRPVQVLLLITLAPAPHASPTPDAPLPRG